MPSFGQASMKRYATLHPNLQSIMDEAIKVMDFSIVCGFRGEEAQNEAFADGKSTKQWPNSKHNQEPSIAVDVAPWNPDLGDIDWDNIDAFILLAGIIKGIAHCQGISVRWGGDFNDNNNMDDENFVDMPHIELVG